MAIEASTSPARRPDAPSREGPQQAFRSAAHGRAPELAWIATHGMAKLALERPYGRIAAQLLLPERLEALHVRP